MEVILKNNNNNKKKKKKTQKKKKHKKKKKKKHGRIRILTGDTSMIFIHQDLSYGKLVLNSNQRGTPSRTILWTLDI